MLDSVLFTTALLQGYEALHACAIATPAGAIAIMAASGGGKSTLLSELLGRGHVLMADDVLVLDHGETGPAVAYPAPPLMTVPTSRLRGLARVDSPETICCLDGEAWIGVPVCPEPLRVKALVLLDRRSHLESQPSLARVENPLAPLLDSLMGFPGGRERERARFELASVLAGEAGLWRLTASLAAPPSALADVLLEGEL